MDFALSLPAIILLVLGFALVVLEMYTPGFGVFGVSGIVLLALGVIAAQPTPLQALIMVAVIVVLLGIALTIFIHSASKGRLSKSPLVLKEVATRGAAENELAYFVGRSGVTHTALCPAGIAEFEGVKLNVVSQGEFIDAGVSVRVACVQGNRIVVQAVKAESSPGDQPQP